MLALTTRSSMPLLLRRMPLTATTTSNSTSSATLSVARALSTLGRSPPTKSSITATMNMAMTTTMTNNSPQKQQQQQQHAKSYSSTTTPEQGQKEASNRVADATPENEEALPGSRAFVECDRAVLIDLFHKYAVNCDVSGRYLDLQGLGQLLRAVGENLDQVTLERLFKTADLNCDGTIELDEFLHSSDTILGGAQAGIVLIVGGPGSGKGLLSKRLEKECGVVHLSSGDLLREEVRRDTVLGRQVQDIMARGELVSSAVIVTLMRRVMRNHPGKRVLLDGFPRSLQNAHDLVELCGVPELALHLECDDTYLMERILKRGDMSKNAKGETERADDNIYTALKRLRTYHKYHDKTMDWLREQHVPVVNLDCGGTPEQVWEQLSAIGRLMRKATRIEESPAALGSTGTPLPSSSVKPNNPNDTSAAA